MAICRFGGTVVVNMLNAKKLFGESVFEPWEKLQEAGTRKEERITVRRSYKRTAPVSYKVVDKPPPKDSKDWGRVVAVVVRSLLPSLYDSSVANRTIGVWHGATEIGP